MTGQSSGGFAVAGADPDEAERRIQQWAQGFAEKAQRYQEVQAQTEQLRLSASSPDGRIKVTVRADGSVTDLEFTDKVRSMPPNELAAQILSTMHRAQADIAGKVGETMAATLGDEDQQTRSMMLDNLRERFPEQPEDEVEEEVSSKWDGPAEDDETPAPPAAPAAAPTAPPAQPRRPRFEDEDDDEFGPDFDPLRD
ncbi:YbaB/EbfC family nucleoid-associated protein [Saccharopolyspora endophytica]|uniref:YbaB/EbfC family nucleoid-associated protein n=1 Tax=Saccharopolyspora endophytica TaxID=543886 RepID=A0ABS5DJ11_9PSEU|nr:YbaB/EbfC family nucleoid-associated protein [Saccharopolyspora endophytica]MBQ0926267.1 YbaB/EbfC family nucleoid-associated protein [Saccharopolyspora endophytica]